ncbi:MAG TPA: AMP-binding protein [Gemmataceae bacterium]|jgi:acyl-[acyl-carrier-protein]-phospholipid O-acyltransferase/long-chain-fatty-acid--[acyl-carrier-protein] ligase|nr:AMP-binding protein [Gemmataceae bacterium]
MEPFGGETVLLSGATVGWVLAAASVWTGWSIAAIEFLALSGLIVTLAVKRPEVLARWICWLPAHLFYRIEVTGRENVPREGGVLFVCNHVSYIDALLVFMAQRRLIRFMIWAPFTHTPVLRQLIKLSRAIPIDGTAGPRAVLQALRAASAALANGEAVCIFAEGGITRTGFLLPFHRGMEQILKRCPVPVVPVCLDHVWGSIFSFKGGKFFGKWPQMLPYPVTIAFGKPLNASTQAVEVRQAIQRLSAECAIRRSEYRRPVHAQFVRMSSKHPLRLCFIDTQSKRKISYGQAQVGARLLAKKLRPLLGHEEMIGIWLPPSVGGALTNVALALMRKVSVNLNYTSSTEVVRSCVRQCKIRHVLTARAFQSRVPIDPGEGVTLLYVEDLFKSITKREKYLTMLSVWLLPAFVVERWILGLDKHQTDDLVTVIFSSGSTGDPKGVMLTHRNLGSNAESMIQAIDPTPRDCLFGILPLFHSFGYTVTLWVPLQVGTSSLYYADPRQAKEIGELCRKHKATIFLSTPTLLRFCLKRCDKDDFRSLRLLMLGAEKLPPSLATEFKEKFGIVPLEGYGCTELSPAAVINVPDWEHNGVKQVGNKSGTIGQPMPGIAAKIVSPETGEALPPGKEGMLLILGGNVMKGYLNKPEATAQVIQDGWYVTGDIARYDDDGFITITDRLSRFSKIGGEMVPHQKIEDELHNLAGTSDRMFTVTGLPDERKGERLVVLHTKLSDGLTVAGLWKKLNDCGLPNLWVPAQRDFYEIPEMPVLGTGKIDLKKVKQLAVERAKSPVAVANE